MHNFIEEILHRQRLSAVFQPVVLMKSGMILGYEGLIRGPENSPWHSPRELFREATAREVRTPVEKLCRNVIVRSFLKLGLREKLFVNITQDSLFELLAEDHSHGLFGAVELQPSSIILELTEQQPFEDHERLKDVIQQLRTQGFEFALDDLGEGYSTLRLWSELRPEYVKIDKHFIQSIHRNPIKLQFVRSIQQIADNIKTRVIAEGVETQAELVILKSLGIHYCQGFYVARPTGAPSNSLSIEVIKAIHDPMDLVPSGTDAQPRGMLTTARKLLIPAEPVAPETPNERVFRLFTTNSDLQSVPVVRNGSPIGLVSRYKLIDFFARLYTRDLYGKKPCMDLMDPEPLIVDVNISLQELSHLLVAGDRRHLSDGFILTENDLYAGVGTGQDLIREITALQIQAARYANPLTLLPGNVPIQEYIERLLQRQCPFVACHCDLDFFKPFNDRYGYGRGDDVIQMTGRLLAGACTPDVDFVGHIGGDDFVLIFQSIDWEERCLSVLHQFRSEIYACFSPEDLERQGYVTEDRKGVPTLHPLTSLSIGATVIEGGTICSHHDVSVWMNESKNQAKKQPGGGLFVDRRTHLATPSAEAEALLGAAELPAR